MPRRASRSSRRLVRFSPCRAYMNNTKTSFHITHDCLNSFAPIEQAARTPRSTHCARHVAHDHSISNFTFTAPLPFEAVYVNFVFKKRPLIKVDDGPRLIVDNVFTIFSFSYQCLPSSSARKFPYHIKRTHDDISIGIRLIRQFMRSSPASVDVHGQCATMSCLCEWDSGEFASSIMPGRA